MSSRSLQLASRIETLTAEIERARAELTLIGAPSVDLLEERRSEMEEELARIRAEMAAVKKETAERTPRASLASAYVVVVLCLLTIYFVNTCR